MAARSWGGVKFTGWSGVESMCGEKMKIEMNQAKAGNEAAGILIRPKVGDSLMEKNSVPCENYSDI